MLQPLNPRNQNLIVNINGRLISRHEAGVSPFDSTVQNGDGVWEGLRLYDGRIFMLHEHLARLRRSAEALAYQGIPPEEQIIEEIRNTLRANEMRDGVHIRLTLSRGEKYTSGLDPRINTKGCSLIILAEHKPPVYDKTGVRLITSQFRRPPASVLDQKIHSCNQLTSILAKIEANAAGADDALMLDTLGYIAETNATHLFLVKGGTVHTPTTDACPEGITRLVILNLCREHAIPIEVRNISPDELSEVEEVFCTGTMGEIAPVIEVDGNPIGTGDPGPLTRCVASYFAELTRTAGVVVV